MTTPKMLRVNSIAMNCPRDLCSAVSVAHTGTIEFKIPVPLPLTRRATIIQVWFIRRARQTSTNSGDERTEEDCADASVAITKSMSTSPARCCYMLSVLACSTCFHQRFILSETITT